VAAVPDASVTPAKLANGGRELGFRNRIINGDMRIVQRATSATVTAGTAVPTASTGYPAVDRFFVYSTGANVTAARVVGDQYRMQITGASGVTAIGVGQRIELLNSYDLAGGNATLSVELANSLLTTVTWTASYATTADTFGTIGTPTKTQIATGTFTVNSTVTNYTAPIAIPAAATTGIEILLTVGAQTSGNWTIGNMQLEAGSVATPFERRDIGREFIMCQRYYIKTFDQGTAPAQNTGIFSGTLAALTGSTGFNGNAAVNWRYPVTMRTPPTIGIFTPGANGTACFTDSGGGFIAASATNVGETACLIFGSGAASVNAYAYVHATAASEL
jgi:hypothetical protein